MASLRRIVCSTASAGLLLILSVVAVTGQPPHQERLESADAGWILASGVAVQEVGHQLSSELTPASLAAGESRQEREELAQARKELSDAELRSRFQKADIVVVGRVKAIRPSGVTTIGVTEHDPDWQEAIIQVESAIKGTQQDQEIVVRFPGSLDVRWYGVPKFKTGQEGTFLLEKDHLSGSPKAVLAGVQVDAYGAGSWRDILSKSEAQRVRTLMQDDLTTRPGFGRHS